MRNDYKVVAITPAGRKVNLEVLEPYILRDRHIIDRWVIWVNTPHPGDLTWIESIGRRHPDFVELVHHPEKIERRQPQAPFFRGTVDPKTVYIKMDDDICFVETGAVETLVDFRLNNRNPFFVMSNTICNGFCAYLHQKYGAQDFKVDGNYERIPPEFGNKVWSSVKYAEYVHKTFIEDLLNQDTLKYKFDSWSLDHFQRVAINCIAWMGSDFAEFGGVINHIDEELWMCCIKAKELGRPNVICGNSLVAHHAFYTHRKPHCAGKDIDSRILTAYKMISRDEGPESVRRVLKVRPML